MKKKVLIIVGLLVVLLLLVVQQAKRMGPGAEGVEKESTAVLAAENHEKDLSAVNVDAMSPSRSLSQLERGEDTASTKKQEVLWKQEELSAAVLTLLGLDGKKHNYPELMQAIKALGFDLSAADVAALRDMLTFSNDRFPSKMRPIEINAVKNDVTCPRL